MWRVFVLGKRVYCIQSKVSPQEHIGPLNKSICGWATPGQTSATEASFKAACGSDGEGSCGTAAGCPYRAVAEAETQG